VLLQTGAAALGSGGEGLVIAGTFHGSPVAVKCPKLLRGVLHMESVGNELRLLRKCRHQNISQLYGAVIDPSHGDLALVMERVVEVCMYSFILGNRRMANTVQLRKHGSSALMESAVRLCICTHGGHG
jgi:serine/threonine protein kinase